MVKNITSCGLSNKASTSLYAVHATPTLDHKNSSKESNVSKKKTKRRIHEQSQAEEITNAVLKDLSNLMINPVSNIHDDISRTSTSISKNRLAVNSKKISKIRGESIPNDESYLPAKLGNDINTPNDRVERRKSLRSAGKRSFLINYCEDSVSSGTTSRRTSDEVSKNSASDVRQSRYLVLLVIIFH